MSEKLGGIALQLNYEIPIEDCEKSLVVLCPCCVIALYSLCQSET